MVFLLQPHSVRAQVVQDLYVTGSSPENGAVSVTAESQITLTFSAPLDTTARYLSGLPVGLLDLDGELSSRINGFSLSPDGLTLTLGIVNPDSSDVAIVITGALSRDGSRLCKPFAFNYSTRGDIGSLYVRGEVWWAVTTKGGECSSYMPEFLVGLFDAPVDAGGKLVAAAISDFPSFSIDIVREGTYWPHFFVDGNWDGEIIPSYNQPGNAATEFGWFDPEEYLGADSISVKPPGLDNIIAMFFWLGTSETTSVPRTVRLDSVYPNPFGNKMTAQIVLDRVSP